MIVVGLSVAGTRQAGIVGFVAQTMPGGHPSDNRPIEAGEVVEVEPDASGTFGLDVDAIESGAGSSRLGNALGDEALSDFIVH